MTLGFVIGESKPTIVTGQTSRSLPIGEYVIINSKEGKIVGLVENQLYQVLHLVMLKIMTRLWKALKLLRSTNVIRATPQ